MFELLATVKNNLPWTWAAYLDPFCENFILPDFSAVKSTYALLILFAVPGRIDSSGDDWKVEQIEIARDWRPHDSSKVAKRVITLEFGATFWYTTVKIK